jgi:hypothetical protein
MFRLSEKRRAVKRKTCEKLENLDRASDSLLQEMALSEFN